MISILILLANNKYTFWKSFWSFIDPLFDKGNSLSIKCFSYTLYLLALIPIIEIVKNELLTSLVVYKELKFDTLDDFINPKVVVWMHDNPNYWRRESEKINDTQLSLKLQTLFKKIDKPYNIHDFISLIQSPDKLRKVGRNYAVIEDEFSLKWFKVN